MLYNIGLIILGIFSGVTVRLIGIGGGLLILPVLIVYYNLDTHFVINIAQFFYIFISGFIFLLSFKSINIKIIRTLSFFIIPGIILGTFIGNNLDGKYLKLLLVLYLIYTAYKFFIKLKHDNMDLNSKPHKKIYYLLGIPSGLLCGSIGIAGGSIFVPLFHFLFNFKMKKAVVHSIGIIFFTAIIAFFSTFYFNSVLSKYYSFKQLYAIALPLTVSGFSGLYIGIKINNIVSYKVIKIIFIIILLISALKILYSCNNNIVDINLKNYINIAE